MLEADYAQGEKIAVILFAEDPNLATAKNILESRSRPPYELQEPSGEGTLARALSYWYRTAWAAYYVAMLKGTDPGDWDALEALRG
jgi:hypothetical protein